MKKLKPSHRFLYGVIQLLYKVFGWNFTTKYFGGLRRFHFKLMYAHLQKQGEGKITPIERVTNITASELKKKYINKGIPVVIEGGAKDWDCVKKWSLDYFKNLHGNDTVTIVGIDKNISEKAFEVTTLEKLIDNIKEKGSKYFRFYPLLQEHPEHIADFDYEFLKKCKSKFSLWEQFQVFIGGKNTYTPLHNAMPSNVFVQVYGEKKWVMYHSYYTSIIDPDKGVNLHRGAPYKTKEGAFNPFEPDYNKPYSAFKYIDGISVHLKPGDIFFNPPHFWHAVKNPTNSIGVGYRWISPGLALKASFWYSFLDLITAPFDKNIYRILKQDYNQIHLSEMGEYKNYLKELKKKQKS